MRGARELHQAACFRDEDSAPVCFPDFPLAGGSESCRLEGVYPPSVGCRPHSPADRGNRPLAALPNRGLNVFVLFPATVSVRSAPRLPSGYRAEASEASEVLVSGKV